MEVRPIASTVSDNTFYLIHDQGEGLLVDPVDPDAAFEAISAAEVGHARVLVTHGHPDHVGASEAISARLGCGILGWGGESDFGFRPDHALIDGATLTVGGAELRVMHVPGHTRCHIALLARGNLISGDLLFVGGVGNCRFGGDAETLARTFRERVASLPDETIFYPGHDYAVRNLEWAARIAPGLSGSAEALARYRTYVGAEAGHYLHSLGEERRCNLFLRCSEPAVQRLAQELAPGIGERVDEPHDRAFVRLRHLRDLG